MAIYVNFEMTYGIDAPSANNQVIEDIILSELSEVTDHIPTFDMVSVDADLWVSAVLKWEKLPLRAAVDLIQAYAGRECYTLTDF